MEAATTRITVGKPGADRAGMNHVAIQAAVDDVAGMGGGVVELTDGVFEMRNAVYLRAGVVLRGQGDRTVLRKCDVRRTKLAEHAYHWDSSALLADPEGFEPGMGVTIGDEREAVRSLVSLRTIVSRTGNRIDLNERLAWSQMLDANALAQTTFPVVLARDVGDVAVEDLRIDGNSAGNQPMIDSWLDGGICLLRVQGGRISRCTVEDVNADGISLETAHDVLVEDCAVSRCARLGIHVGSGSLRPVVRDCRVTGNGWANVPFAPENQDGLYLCWGIRHGRFEHNEITENVGCGITLGHGDADNVFIDNVICRNRRAGILYRTDTYRAYRNIFRGCRIEDNGGAKPPPEGTGCGVYMRGDADHTRLENCTIRDTRPKGRRTQRVGVFVDPSLQDVVLTDCLVEDHPDGNEVYGYSP